MTYPGSFFLFETETTNITDDSKSSCS